MTILDWKNAALRQVPPWLTRAIGRAVTKGMASPVDEMQANTAEAITLRFPGGSDENNVVIHPEALSLLGRERRILRGPGEADETFAERLRGFWDAHRTRGGAYALLQQMHDFFLSTNNAPIQYINQVGASVTIDAAGAFTRSTIDTWTGDGQNPTQWARFFLVFYLDGETISVPLVTEDGEPVVTEDGEAITVEVSIFDLDAEDIETLCAVPREWSAAHIDRIYIVLMPAGGYAWGLPPGTRWGDPGLTWGGGLSPAVITC